MAFLNSFYCMVSSVSVRDEPNAGFWLATGAGKRVLSCLLGTTHSCLQENRFLKANNKTFIDQAWNWTRCLPWVCKMNQILDCDWLLERAKGCYLACLGPPTVVCKKTFPWKQIINPLYWPSLIGQDAWILAVFFFMDLDSISVHKHAKKKHWANIQPSWPIKLGQ